MIAIIMITVFMAMSSAADDDHQIRADRPIHHGAQWMARAFVLVILAWLLDQTWMVLGLWGLFSAVFRFSLNRFRGLDVRYLSPSSWYDWTFIWIGSLPGRGFYVSALLDNEARKTIEAQWGTVGYHAGWEPYVRWAHRGGTIAYIVELASFVAVTAWLW